MPDDILKGFEEDLVRVWGRQEYTWKTLNKGFVNSSYLAVDENDNPLMICKFYPEDEIYKAEERREREDSVFDFMSKTHLNRRIAPVRFPSSSKEIVSYFYVEGIELHEIEVDDEVKASLERTLTILHNTRNKSKQWNKTPQPEEVTMYYNTLLLRFTSSKYQYPKDLLNEFEKIINKQTMFLEKYSDYLTYVHGDLVPPNIIIDRSVQRPPFGNREPVVLIDWEFYRPELSFFDYVYFNYYARAHKLPIQLEVDKEIEEFYLKLVDVLEKLWEFGYKMKHSKEFKVNNKN